MDTNDWLPTWRRPPRIVREDVKPSDLTPGGVTWVDPQEEPQPTVMYSDDDGETWHPLDMPASFHSPWNVKGRG